MKKITLFLAAMAITLNVAATDYPSAFLDGFPCDWFGAGEYLAEPTGKTANAYYLGEHFYADQDDPDFNGITFDDVWNDVIKEPAYELNTSAANGKVKVGDYEFAGFKAGYDSENIYIFVNYIDDDNPPLGSDIEQLELGISPYYKLEADRTPTVDGADAPALQYIRFLELGAYKVTASLGGSLISIANLSVEHRTAADVPNPDLNVFVNSQTNPMTPSDIRLIITLPFMSLTNNMTGSGDYFSLKEWFELNESQGGISLDLKIEDVDRNEADTDVRYYWWSCPALNNGQDDISYYSTSSSGMLKAMPKISTDDVDVQPSNIKVTPEMILLTNPADVKIYSAASGALIFSQANATSVSTSILTAGIYIVEANGEVAKFAK